MMNLQYILLCAKINALFAEYILLVSDEDMLVDQVYCSLLAAQHIERQIFYYKSVCTVI